MKQSLLSSWRNVGRTLAMTVGSPSAHRRGTMLKLISVLVLILTIGVGQMWGGKYTINYNDSFTPALPTASGSENSTSTAHTVSSLAIKEQGIYKGSFNNYLMFVSGKGFLYNTSNLVTVTSVAATYSSSTSTSGKTGVYFGTSEKSTYTTSSNATIKGQSQTDTWTNSTAGNGYFQLSTSNKNVQITQIVITCWTKVTLDKNGGTADGVAYFDDNATAASTATGYAFSAATRTGNYTCTGYYTAASNGTKVLNANGTFAAANVSGYITSNKWTYTGATLKLYAHWEEAAVSTPTLTLTGSGAFGNVDVDDTKDLNFTLTGANLTANATVSVSGTGFSLVTPSNGTLTQTAGSITGSNNITVRFAPTTSGAHNGTLTVSSTGATDASISLSGTGIVYDHFIDEVHNTEGYTGAGMAKGGDYSSSIPTIADKDAGSGNCQALHYHFCGWVTEANRANPHGHLATINGTATGTTYYAVWSKGSGSGGPNDFTLVESSQDDWSGTYLLVNYSDNDHAMSSDLSSGKFAGVEVEPSNKVITCTNNKLIWTLAKGTGDNASKYSVKSNQTNTYAGIGSGSTTGSLNNDAQWLSLSYDNNHQVKISGSSGRNFSYYSSNTDFRTYSSANGFYLYKKNEVTYSDSISVCCTELGSINGSVSLSQIANGDDKGKLQASWDSQTSTAGWASPGIVINIYEDGNNTPVVTSSALANNTTSFTATDFTPKTCTQYYATLTALNGGASGYCAGDLVSVPSAKVTTAGYTYTNSSTNVNLVAALPASTCANGGADVDIQFTAATGYRLPTTDEEIAANVSVTNAGEKDEDWFCSVANDVLTISLNPSKATGNIGITVNGIVTVIPQITVSTDEINFNEVKKGTPTSTTFTVEGANLNNANITLSYSATEGDDDVFTFSKTTLIPSDYANPGIEITLTANTATAGEYYGTITISDGNAGATDKTIDVYLTVLETYTVNFYINSITTPAVEAQTDVQGIALVVPTVNVASINDCADANYVFKGWTNTTNYTHGTSTLITNTTGLAIGDADANYYAVFALKDGEDGYAELTDVADLEEGDKIVITGKNGDNYYGMKAYSGTDNNFKGTAITVASNKITELEDACELTLGGSANAWTFYDGAKYVYSAGSSKSGSGYNNYMKGKDALGDDHACEWTIAIDGEGVTSITSNTNSATPHMRFNYNNGSPLFSCYNTTNQSAVTLYKKVSATYSDYRLVCPHYYIVALSPATNGNGTISFAKNASAITEIETTGENDVTVDVVAAPATGYELSGVALSGIAGASYSAGVITLPANTEGTLTATATFAKANYAVTYTSPSNGTYTVKVGDAAAVSANTTAQYGQTITLLAGEPATGYQFIGWSVTKTASSTAIAVDGNNQFTMPAEAVTVAANFQEIPAVAYTVTFDDGAGTLVCNDCENDALEEASAGAGVTLPSCTAATGYAFLGWTATENKTTVDEGLTAGETYRPEANVTLYAVYKQLKAVTLMKRDDSGTDVVLYEDVATGKVELPARTCKNNDYTFAGWSTTYYSTEQEDENAVILSAGDYTPEGNITLYPVFTRSGENFVWTKVTDLSTVTEGTYALVSTADYAFNGSISSGHGQKTTNAFAFTNDVAENVPEGTCVLEFQEVTENEVVVGYKMYNETNGYLYASAASSGKLAWHESESSYWKYANSNWVYNSNSAYLRVYDNTFRTYSGNSNNALALAKKTAVQYSLYLAAPANIVKAPTFAPVAGAYYGTQTVTLSCETEGVSYYYTEDGTTTPTTASTPYAENISVSASKTIKAIAVDEDGFSSPVAEAAYTIYPVYNSIAEYVAADAVASATAKVLIDKASANAIVIGVNGSYTYVQDGTAALIIKRPNSNDPWTVGHELDGYIIGTRSLNYGITMITVADVEHISTSEGTLPTAQPVSNLNFADAWASYAGNLIKVSNVYFQAQATSDRAVALADGNSNSGAIYDALFKINGVDLPLTETACDVTGVLVAKTVDQTTTYYIAPTKAEDITTNGALAFLNVNPIGGEDAEHAVGVAPNGQVTITPVEGFTTTLNEATITEISNVTIAEPTSITVSASRTYYTTNTKTYYYEVDESYKAIIVNQSTGGTISADLASAVAGTPITLTATPNSHYHFVSWSVTYNDGEEKSITPDGNNQFTMVDYNVTVTATFAEDLKYTIAFDDNDATSGNVPTVEAKYANTSFTVPGKGDLKKTGASFTGWKVGGADVAVGSSYTTPVEVPTEATTITFVAQWEDLPVWATEYHSNVTLVGGGSHEDAQVVIGDSTYTAEKGGSNNNTGTVSFTVPVGTNAVHFHGFAWANKNCTISVAASPAVTNISQSSFALAGNAAGAGSGTYTINTDPADQYFAFTFDAVEAATTFTFSKSGGSDNRFIIYGVNAIYPEIKLSPATYDFENVRAGQNKTQEFTITPNANVSGTLSASIIDDENGKYSVTDIENGKVTVTFAPGEAESGTFEAKLKVWATNALVTADLTGTAIAALAPEITVDKNAVAFGRVNPNAEVSEDIQIGLLNIEGAVNAALSGDDSEKFGLSAESFTEDGVLTITPNTTENGIFEATLTLSATGADDVVLPITMTVASKWAAMYTSNIIPAGTGMESKKVNINSTDYNAYKKAEGNDVTITLPRGTQKLHLHMVAWNKQGGNVTISGACFNNDKIINVPENEDVSGTTGTYVFTEKLALSYYHELLLDNVNNNSTTTVTVSKSGSRIILFGVNQEGGIVEISDDMNASALEDNANIEVKEGATLTVDADKALDNLTVEAGGAVSVADNMTLEVNNFAIETTMASGKSGQLSIGTDGTFTASGEAYIDITLGAAGNRENQWHAFTVPFPVDALNGIYDAETGAKLQNEVNYAIMDYHGDIRATGDYGWKKFRGIMTPGTFYLMTVDGERSTYRMKKTADGALVADAKMNLEEYPSSTGNNDNGWNGVGNPTLRYGKVNYSAQVLNPTSNTYETFEANETNFVVGTPFFIQANAAAAAADMTFGPASGTANYAPKRTPAKSIESIKVRFGNEEYMDKLYVSASEDALNQYETGKDLAKMTMTNTPSVAQIFGMAYNTKLCMVNTPLVNNKAEVALELYAPADGEYTISAEEREDATVYLLYEGRIIWNLSAGAYTSDFVKGNNAGYGIRVVKAPKVTTGIENEPTSDSLKGRVSKVVIDNNVFILRNGQMFDVTGKMAK